MRKVVCCCECSRQRDAHRPIVRLLSGAVLFVCRQCWKALYWYVMDNGVDPPEIRWYLWEPMLPEDRELLR